MILIFVCLAIVNIFPDLFFNTFKIMSLNLHFFNTEKSERYNIFKNLLTGTSYYDNIHSISCDTVPYLIHELFFNPFLPKKSTPASLIEFLVYIYSLLLIFLSFSGVLSLLVGPYPSVCRLIPCISRYGNKNKKML